MVSDLDGHLTNRALESLGAELRRRERILAKAGAKDIEDYLAAKTPEDEPLPRLLIIIDEFAALVQELPDFVDGLIDITRRGRSLGTHLILATQRPAGVVSAEIKSNTNLRIALRVTDAGDSTDVIDAPEAAYIPKTLPGRAYARLGHSSLITFQSSRVGGRPPGAVEETPATAWAYSTKDLCSAPPNQDNDEEGSVIPTDLANLVTAIKQAADTTGIHSPPPPWLPALPPVVTVDELIDQFPIATPGPGHLVLPIGLTDLPGQQRRDLAVYDIERGTHLAIAGANRTGRSSVLRVIGATIGRYLSPDDVHIYGVDCGNNALLPLANLPHVGAIVTREQSERLDRLVTMLRRTIATRQQLLSSQGFADVREQREVVTETERLPYIVVLFDSWEGFMQVYNEFDSGRFLSAWLQVLQEGASVGVRMLVTGDQSVLSTRISAMFPDKLLLRMPSAGDFVSIGMNPKNVPASFVAGRGFRAAGLVETQIALLDPDPTGPAQAGAVQSIVQEAVRRCADHPRERRPARVDTLPAHFSVSQLPQLGHGALRPTEIPVAVGGDTLGLRTLDSIDNGPAILVSGPRRSGRSTVLRTMATFAVRQGWNIVILTARISPLRRFPMSDQVYGRFDADVQQETIKTALSNLLAQGVPSMVLADDVEVLGQEGWLPDLLFDHIQAIRDSGSLFVGSFAPLDMSGMYRGPVKALKTCRSGVLLAPQEAGDASTFGATLYQSAFGQSMPPGGGFLIKDGDPERVQVIWPE